MTRFILLTIALLAGGAWILQGIFDSSDFEPRRYSIGETDDGTLVLPTENATNSLGSIKVPFGWKPVQHRASGESVDTYFAPIGEDNAGGPTIRVSATRTLVDEEKESDLSPGRLLALEDTNERYYDSGRRLDWQRTGNASRDVVDVNIHWPYDVHLRFTAAKEEPLFEPTIVSIVDSYSVNAHVPDYQVSVSSLLESSGRKLVFRMTDKDRMVRNVWALGSLVVLFGLLLADRYVQGQASASDGERAAPDRIPFDDSDTNADGVSDMVKLNSGEAIRSPLPDPIRLDEDILAFSEANSLEDAPELEMNRAIGMIAESERLRREQRSGPRGTTIPVDSGHAGMHTVHTDASESEMDDDLEVTGESDTEESSAALARRVNQLVSGEALSSAEAFHAVMIFLEHRSFFGQTESIEDLAGQMTDLSKGRPDDGTLLSQWEKAVAAAKKANARKSSDT